MALTATAQSALPPELSWDETIVPALRKRLESESRVLSKRMSTASIPSADDVQPFQQNPSRSRPRGANTRSPPGDITHPKPSAIPRPSLQSTRQTSEDSASSSSQYHRPAAPLRARTYSTPYMFDPKLASGNEGRSSHNVSVLPTPASSRSNSPMVPSTTPRQTEVKPTRIPKVARTRSGSMTTSNHGHGLANGVDLKNGTSSNHGHGHAHYPTPETSPDLWPHHEAAANSQSSRSTLSVAVARSERPDAPTILHEPPPFSAKSFGSSFEDDNTEFSHRPSAEEERPFEHWYRGEVSRNGGVGELRVGNRIEMLEIANYGHKLRSAPAHTSPATSTTALAGRQRAESIGARESFYFDEDARAVTEMVLDEMPLTDMEDVETDRDTSTTYHDAETALPAETSPTTPRAPSRQRSTTASSRAPSSRAATPSSSSQQPPAAAQTPGTRPLKSVLRQTRQQQTRGASEPPERNPPQGQRGAAVPVSQSLSVASTQTQKRARTKSPQPSPSKKVKGAAQQRRAKSNAEASREGAEYPELSEAPGGMADAIPSWTQPKPKAGNWDEVVLPVVARKMGLEDQYEAADGSPQPQRREEPIPPPAPGTFGFDHSKYRPPRGPGEDIPMDEFGQLPERTPEDDESVDEERTPTATSHPKVPQSPRARMSIDPPRLAVRGRPQTPPSPAPFAHYATPTPEGDAQARAWRVEAAAERVEAKEEAGGCCKCVIM